MNGFERNHIVLAEEGGGRFANRPYAGGVPFNA